MDNALIGTRIKAARDLRGKTFDEIADDIGVAKSTVQRYEAGKISKIKIPVLNAIANSLDVNPVWLSGYDAPMMIEKVVEAPLDLRTDEKQLLTSYNRLNTDGQTALQEYADYLESNPRYTKDTGLRDA